MADTLSPRAWSRTARARVASHNPVRPVRSNRWSALRSLRVSRSGRARCPPFFMRRRVSHGRATLGSNFRDTALAVDRAFPIVRHPAPGTRTPVLVSVPHYGTEPLPHITRDDYREPSFETFAYGFADTFVGDLYGDLYKEGATVLATPFSRMFVDVNRRRDDFEHHDGEVRSRRGVVRTHTMRDTPI